MKRHQFVLTMERVDDAEITRLKRYDDWEHDDWGMTVDDAYEIGTTLAFTLRSLMAARGIDIGEEATWSPKKMAAYILSCALRECGGPVFSWTPTTGPSCEDLTQPTK